MYLQPVISGNHAHPERLADVPLVLCSKERDLYYPPPTFCNCCRARLRVSDGAAGAAGSGFGVAGGALVLCIKPTSSLLELQTPILHYEISYG